MVATMGRSNILGHTNMLEFRNDPCVDPRNPLDSQQLTRIKLEHMHYISMTDLSKVSRISA